MSGETQPGGRVPAPGKLGLVQAFLNTHYDLDAGGGDVFADARALQAWLVRHRLIEPGVSVDPADLRRVIGVRETLRDLAARRRHAPLLATVELRVEDAAPRLRPADAGTVDGAIAELLAIVVAEMSTTRWSRLKVCPGEDCGWAFYDHSRNRTGRWCSMTVCGSRAKAQAHYRRRRRQ